MNYNQAKKSIKSNIPPISQLLIFINDKPLSRCLRVKRGKVGKVGEHRTGSAALGKYQGRVFQLLVAISLRLLVIPGQIKLQQPTHHRLVALPRHLVKVFGERIQLEVIVRQIQILQARHLVEVHAGKAIQPISRQIQALQRLEQRLS